MRLCSTCLTYLRRGARRSGTLSELCELRCDWAVNDEAPCS